MNIPPILIREPAFLELREKLGLGAMHALVAIGTILQSKREDKIKLTSKRQLLMSCDLVGDVDPELLWDAIVGTWLIPIGNDEYSMPLFAEHNKQLLTNWENGKKTQRKATEEKAMKEKTNQSNATQLNRDAPVGAGGTAPPTACHMGEEDLMREHGIPTGIEPRQPSPDYDDEPMEPF